ncbi:MAG: flagellar motor switch protein FliM [Blastochloris viridis]|uniref:Flagellar motor switch protein FliM n=1 Tax=Blastochloris viridis TaxID=1079 RepID=A0A6N4R979_BLAVI|nr:MAG: flagellar motor switch protein FliM [Blastochloris viridis]
MAETPDAPAKSEEELLKEWQNMAADDGTGGGDDEMAKAMAAGGEPQKILDQGEIDALLGIDAGAQADGSRGVRALLDQSVVNYEKLPMLEVVYDKFERLLSTSLRQYTADNVDVTIMNMTSVRFGDYLNQVPLPAGIVVVNAVGLEDYVLLVYESNLIYAVVDVMLGGRKSRQVSVAGRQFTAIERKILDTLTDIVLANLGEAFGPIAPIQFKAERMEVNPRFTVISQEANVAILVTVKVDLEGREGRMQFCLPYATLEPIREQLLQQFMGEKFGQDNIWENHLSQELYHTTMELDAVLDQMTFPLSEVLEWRVGDTFLLNARSNSPIRLECGGVTKMVGQMGKALDFKAVRITHNITDLNNLKQT